MSNELNEYPAGPLKGDPSELFDGLTKEQQEKLAREIEESFRLVAPKLRYRILTAAQREREAFIQTNLKPGVDPGKFEAAYQELENLRTLPMTPENMKRRRELSNMMDEASRRKASSLNSYDSFGPLAKERPGDE